MMKAALFRLLTFAFLLPPSLLRRPRGEVEVYGEARGLKVVQGDAAAEHAEQPMRDDEAELIHVSAALVRRVYIYGLEQEPSSVISTRTHAPPVGEACTRTAPPERLRLMAKVRKL